MERFGDARFDRCLAQGAMATPLLEALPQAFQTARVATDERGGVEHDAQADATLEELQQRVRLDNFVNRRSNNDRCLSCGGGHDNDCRHPTVSQVLHV